MDAAAIYKRLKAQFPNIGELHLDGKDPWIQVEPQAIVEVCRFAHDDPELRFDCLMNESAVDWKERDALQVVYHLFSYAKHHHAVLKVDVPRDNPRVPTVEGIWKIANWQ